MRLPYRVTFAPPPITVEVWARNDNDAKVLTVAMIGTAGFDEHDSFTVEQLHVVKPGVVK